MERTGNLARYWPTLAYRHRITEEWGKEKEMANAKFQSNVSK